MARIDVRDLEEYTPLPEPQFRERFMRRFHDPAFDDMRDELERLCQRAYEAYIDYRKWPRTVPAGEGFADPDFEVAPEWLETRHAIDAAAARQQDAGSPSRVLLVNGSTRTSNSCPGESSKTRRLAHAAREAIEEQQGFEVDFLDLSELASEPLKVIYPCKACVSTAMPLCHWPCSCYPNYATGQADDWMNELYPRWVAAHGVMILCPVHWYQTPASLKLMIDRLVCADGGNPDITSTGGKDPHKAKELELAGWPYPRHLAGRAYAVFAHADAAGAGTVRRALSDWLGDIGLIAAGHSAVRESYIGYLQPYATSHADLDADEAVFGEVRNAALSLCECVRQIRSGAYRPPDQGLEEPRPK